MFGNGACDEWFGNLGAKNIAQSVNSCLVAVIRGWKLGAKKRHAVLEFMSGDCDPVQSLNSCLPRYLATLMSSLVCSTITMQLRGVNANRNQAVQTAPDGPV